MAGAGAARSTGAVGSLRDVAGIAVTQFGSSDVVRHPLVARIVEAYETAGARTEAAVQAEREERTSNGTSPSFQEGKRSSARGGRS